MSDDTHKDSHSISSLNSLCELVTHEILGQRNIIRDMTNLGSETSFGLRVQLFQEFRDAFTPISDQWFTTHSHNPTTPLDLVLYISVHTAQGISRDCLLEEWKIHWIPPQEQEAILDDMSTSWSDLPELHQLLRSISCTLRLLPASYLQKEFTTKPNKFSFRFELSAGKRTKTFSTAVLRTQSLAQISRPGLGTLSAQVRYREECEKYSAPQLIAVDNMEASYYPQKMKGASVAAPVVADSTSKKEEQNKEQSHALPAVPSSSSPSSEVKEEEDSTLKVFANCISHINSQMNISPDVDQALMSLSGFHDPPDLSESMENPAIYQFQQAVSDLRNLEMLQRVATYSRNDLHDLARI